MFHLMRNIIDTPPPHTPSRMPQRFVMQTVHGRHGYVEHAWNIMQKYLFLDIFVCVTPTACVTPIGCVTHTVCVTPIGFVTTTPCVTYIICVTPIACITPIAYVTSIACVTLIFSA